ncbi:MAG: gamma-glutamyltranspeptidase / glutathione hydrolase [Acidimicrobiaceae bacterium]|nr:gamma-glutamyltranspeptidase / glutathione hydrolase [Acidimicrobiaceae bacterium]
MVSAVDHLAAQAGIAMLQAGGTAADAAVSASAVLAVTSQHMCGMGGDLYAVVAVPGADPIALNASGRAGSGADPDRLRAEGHVTMPFRGDIRSVPVPGCVDGWLALHQRYGRLPLEQVVGPARWYAEQGFPASATLAASVSAIAHLPEAADFTAPGPIRAGTLIRRPGVGRALADITARGRDGFYGGEFGEGLLRLGGGEFTPADLELASAEWVPALAIEAWGRRIWTAPPNSQGYLTLAGAWIACGLPLPSNPNDDRWPHLLIEASRQAAYDRDAVLHDGASGAELLDADRLGARRDGVDLARAAVLGGTFGGGGTMALSAVDQDRMGVSLVQSNASGFGAHIAVPGVRIFLQNRGIGFSLRAGHANEYRAGRRPAHTLCPTTVTNLDGSLAGVVGTMGGDSQPQILLQLLARWLLGGQPAGDALAAGRWALRSPTDETHFNTWGDRGVVEVTIEGQAPASWAAGLERRGHHTALAPAWSSSFGYAHMVTVDGDHLAGAADPRSGSGAVAGY